MVYITQRKVREMRIVLVEIEIHQVSKFPEDVAVGKVQILLGIKATSFDKTLCKRRIMIWICAIARMW